MKIAENRPIGHQTTHETKEKSYNGYNTSKIEQK